MIWAAVALIAANSVVPISVGTPASSATRALVAHTPHSITVAPAVATAPTPAPSISLPLVSSTSGAPTTHSAPNNEDAKTYLQGVQTSVTFINFVFIIVVFFVARSDRKKTLAREDGVRLAAIEAFWFQRLVLEPNLSKILALFDHCDKSVAEFPAKGKGLQEHAGEEAIAALKSLRRPLIADLINVLYAIDVAFADQVATILDDVEDACSDFFDNQLTQEVAEERVRELRRKLLSQLFARHSRAAKID